MWTLPCSTWSTFTEELIKPSVFRNAASLPSKLFTLFIVIYYKATTSPFTQEGRYLLASLIQQKMDALSGFLCFKILQKCTQKWLNTVSVMNLFLIRLKTSFIIAFFMYVSLIWTCVSYSISINLSIHCMKYFVNANLHI